jgi:hypothetical protein
MSEVVNPVEIEQAIREIVGIISEGVKVVSARLDAYKTAEREYDLAFAQAYMAYDGPAHAKKYAAEIRTTELRATMDAAEVAWRYAERRARASEDQLSAWQTIGRIVQGMYSAAGTQGYGG